MKHDIGMRRVAIVLAIAWFLPGCQSALNAVPSGAVATDDTSLRNQSANSVTSDSAHFLYVRNSNNITIYTDPNNGHPRLLRVLKIGLDGGPAYFTFDRAGTLYAVNSVRGTIVVFPKGATRPSRTIKTGLAHPFGIAVRDKQIYVATTETSDAHPPVIAVLPIDSNSSTKPRFLRGITFQNQPVGLNVDDHGRLWFAGGSSSNGALYYYASESGLPRKAPMKALPGPLDIVFTPTGDIIVTTSDQNGMSCQLFHRFAASPYLKIAYSGYGSLGAAYEVRNGNLWIPLISEVNDLQGQVVEVNPVTQQQARTIKKATGDAAFVALGPTF